MARPGRSFVFSGSLALLVALGSTAHAAEPAAARAPDAATAESSDANDQARLAALRSTPLEKRRWALFDPFFSARESLLFGGPVSLREIDQQRSLHGLTIGFGDTTRETRGPLWLSLERNFDVRLLSKWTVLAEFTSYTYQAGFRLGPIEIGAGPGLNVLAVDVSDGDWSLSGLSPRANVKAGLKTGSVRVSLSAYRAFQWRWLGRPNAYLTGFSLELALEAPRRSRFAGHPVVLTK